MKLNLSTLRLGRLLRIDQQQTLFAVPDRYHPRHPVGSTSISVPRKRLRQPRCSLLRQCTTPRTLTGRNLVQKAGNSLKMITIACRPTIVAARVGPIRPLHHATTDPDLPSLVKMGRLVTIGSIQAPSENTVAARIALTTVMEESVRTTAVETRARITPRPRRIFLTTVVERSALFRIIVPGKTALITPVQNSVAE